MFPGLHVANEASEGSPVSSSTGTSDARTNASNKDTRITNEKNGTRKVSFVRRVIVDE